MSESTKGIHQMMTKASTWLLTTELQQIDDKRGDISRSLFIRRAIRNALQDKGEVGKKGGTKEK